VKFIKLSRIRRAGHVTRVDESDPAREVLCTQPGGIGDSKRGRPKYRWCEELKKDVAWVGYRNWRLNGGVAESY
jgi:hypothetical protein